MSPERFQPYIRRADGCRVGAVKLQERNLQLSEALLELEHPLIELLEGALEF
jgi:hypothetical protein